jgi:hypothetical protein
MRDLKTHRPHQSNRVFTVSCDVCEIDWEAPTRRGGVCPSCQDGGALHHCVGCTAPLSPGAQDVACDTCKSD